MDRWEVQHRFERLAMPSEVKVKNRRVGMILLGIFIVLFVSAVFFVIIRN